MEDGNGGSTPLHELIADDKAIDLTSRLDAKLTLESYPKRFVDLAYKKYAGYPLTESERSYYRREKKGAKNSSLTDQKRGKTTLYIVRGLKPLGCYLLMPAGCGLVIVLKTE